MICNKIKPTNQLESSLNTKKIYLCFSRRPYLKGNAIFEIGLPFSVSILLPAPHHQQYIFSQPGIGIMVRVFTNGSRDLRLILGRVIPKTQRWYLMPPWLKLGVIRNGSRGSGVIKHRLLLFGVLAIAKGAFVSPLTTISQLEYIYIYYAIIKLKITTNGLYFCSDIHSCFLSNQRYIIDMGCPGDKIWCNSKYIFWSRGTSRTSNSDSYFPGIHFFPYISPVFYKDAFGIK